MCLVLDVNSFHCVFDQSSQNHPAFKPVFDWLFIGKGKLVMGGAKYDDEISKMKKYTRLLKLLRSCNKIVRADDQSVDSMAREIERVCPDTDFDDHHIVALLSVSGCQLFCSEDQRSYKYVKRKDFYRNGSVPKIYRSKSLKRAKYLLSDHHISGICAPCSVLPKPSRDQLLAMCSSI